MPKTAEAGAPAQGTTTDSLRQRADALYRCAAECCRQHDRIARLLDRNPTPTEQRITTEVVKLCDQALAQISADYEKCGARVHPTGEDEAWWHRANALWMAARDYARRHMLADRVTRNGSGDSPATLGDVQIGYELEASALLALRQALTAYCKARPGIE